MTDFIDLAERCERAPAPDRFLADDVLRAFGWIIEPYGLPNFYRPDPTASLDAAMSLISEKWTAWGVWSREGRTAFYAILSRLRDDFDKDELDEEQDIRSKRCASPALAVCAAALRARADA